VRAGRIEGSLFRTLAQNSRNVDERFMLPLELSRLLEEVTARHSSVVGVLELWE
jgi:hypothetical protein